jgi:poly(A) polymerase
MTTTVRIPTPLRSFTNGAASGEVSAELEAWWRAFQQADADTRKAMLLPDTGPRKKRRRRRRRQDPAGGAASQA